MRVIAGPNGSGKSTFLRLLRREWIGPFVNADLIEKSIRDTRRLDLRKFGVTRTPDDRLQRHYQISGQLRRAGLLKRVEAVQTDGPFILFENLAGSVDSYLAAATAEFIRLELIDLGGFLHLRDGDVPPQQGGLYETGTRTRVSDLPVLRGH